ncbi:MAG: hypothetical protein CMJ64_09055 [Planctomycetaceae bacterium]|nr:hypothetical protein [Planctomycetaceae bacterium]
MARANFENLRVYQLSEELADSVWDVITKWQNLARDTVGKQLVRSADSIGANISEGSRRGSAVDNRRFVRIARGSLYETKHWLRRAYRRKLLPAEQVDSLKALIEEVTKTLNGHLRSLDKRA